MTSPLSRISAGSFFSGYRFEYSSFGWPGTTVVGTNSILSIRPSSIAAIRTLRANGEAGEKVSFIGCPCKICERQISRHCERSEAIHSSGRRSGKSGLVRRYAPRNDDGADGGSPRSSASRRDDLLALFAEPFDAERDDVADVEELRRLHAGADARRGAGGDDVAGQQRHELRDVGNALRHREDHGRGRSPLATLAVDVEPHRQFLHVRNLVLGDKPRAERTERVMRLALGPLPQALDLKVALGDVVADAIAGDVIKRIGLGDIFGAGPDDGGDLDFPVELGRAARLLNLVVGAAQRRVGLQEEDRFCGNRISGLLGMVDIVQANSDEFRDAGDGSAEPRLAIDGGKLGGIEAGEFGQRGRRIGLAIEVLHMIRQIAQLTRFIDQAGLFLADRTVTNKLHVDLSLGGFLSLDASWNSAGRNSTADCALHCRVPHPRITAPPLLLDERPPAASRR